MLAPINVPRPMLAKRRAGKRSPISVPGANDQPSSGVAAIKRKSYCGT
jgi:hypothetical protein